jgi:hypothetical protein
VWFQYENKKMMVKLRWTAWQLEPPSWRNQNFSNVFLSQSVFSMIKLGISRELFDFLSVVYYTHNIEYWTSKITDNEAEAAEAATIRLQHFLFIWEQTFET